MNHCIPCNILWAVISDSKNWSKYTKKYDAGRFGFWSSNFIIIGSCFDTLELTEVFCSVISISDADPLYEFLHRPLFHAYCKFFLEPNFSFLEIFSEKGIELSKTAQKVFRYFCDEIDFSISNTEKTISKLIGFIDVIDACWLRKVLVTIMRCEWQLWPFWSPTSVIFLH